MLRKIYLLIIVISILTAGCSSFKMVLVEKSVNFPRTDKVTILMKDPEAPNVVIAIMETKGGNKKSLLEALVEMERSAKEIGADALVAKMYRNRSRLKNKKDEFTLRGTAIKYTSSIKDLVQGNVSWKGQSERLTFGCHFNLLPFILKGHDASIWLGKGHMRVRAGTYALNTPAAFWNDNFSNAKIEMAQELSVDYFFFHGFQGFYISNGINYYRGSVGHEKESVRGYHYNYSYVLGVGYNLSISKHFSVSTKAFGNLILYGDRQFMVGTRPAYLDAMAPGFSIGIGWHN